MLKVNLASRPFYNERLVTVAVAALALVALGLAAFNAYELVTLSQQRAALQTRIAHDAAVAATTEAQAGAVTHAVDRGVLNGLALETSEANALIAERTFSWTTFLGLIEKAMPADVRLVSVAPRVDAGQMWITMLIIAKRPEDQAAFMDALDGTGAFFDVQPRDEDVTDDGMRRATMRARYVEPPITTAPPAPAKGGRP
jgi:hypothetical protein